MEDREILKYQELIEEKINDCINSAKMELSA